MAPFTAVFQYRRFFASPESGGIGVADCINLSTTFHNAALFLKTNLQFWIALYIIYILGHREWYLFYAILLEQCCCNNISQKTWCTVAWTMMSTSS